MNVAPTTAEMTPGAMNRAPTTAGMTPGRDESRPYRVMVLGVMNVAPTG